MSRIVIVTLIYHRHRHVDNNLFEFSVLTIPDARLKSQQK
jgi:hypothetical protein